MSNSLNCKNRERFTEAVAGYMAAPHDIYIQTAGKGTMYSGWLQRLIRIGKALIFYPARPSHPWESSTRPCIASINREGKAKRQGAPHMQGWWRDEEEGNKSRKRLCVKERKKRGGGCKCVLICKEKEKIFFLNSTAFKYQWIKYSSNK